MRSMVEGSPGAGAGPARGQSRDSYVTVPRLSLCISENAPTLGPSLRAGRGGS